jgi:hypothetical protein
MPNGNRACESALNGAESLSKEDCMDDEYRRRLEELPVTLNVKVTAVHRTKLEEYARGHNISLAEATRRAIDALLREEHPRESSL